MNAAQGKKQVSGIRKWRNLFLWRFAQNLTAEMDFPEGESLTADSCPFQNMDLRLMTTISFPYGIIKLRI